MNSAFGKKGWRNERASEGVYKCPVVDNMFQAFLFGVEYRAEVVKPFTSSQCQAFDKRVKELRMKTSSSRLLTNSNDAATLEILQEESMEQRMAEVERQLVELAQLLAQLVDRKAPLYPCND